MLAAIRTAADQILAELGEGPGLALAVAVEGEETLVCAKGYSDLETNEPLSVDTLLPLASITKQMTGMCAAVLHERGVFNLDAPLGDYVQGLSEQVARPTIRQLLSHRSGLRCHLDHQLLSGVGERPDGFAMEALRACRSVNAGPGEMLVYGNGGFHLAARAIEVAAGNDFAPLMKATLFDPLQMTATRILPTRASRAQGCARLYAPSDSGFKDVSDLNHESLGEGGGWSTVGDLINWIRAVRAEDTRLPAEAWRALKTRPRLPDGAASCYGLGLAMTSFRGVQLLGHGGAIMGANAAVIAAADHPVEIALLSNCMVPADQLAKRLLAAAIGEDRLAAVPTTATATDRSTWLGKVYGDEVMSLVFTEAAGALAISLQGSPPLPLQDGAAADSFVLEGGLSPSGVSARGETQDGAPQHVDLQFAGRNYHLARLKTEADALGETKADAAGVFVCHELGYSMTIQADADGLDVRSEGPFGRWSGRAQPIAPNLLRLIGEWYACTLRLKRAAGQVVGLEVSSTRTYGLEFSKAPDLAA